MIKYNKKEIASLMNNENVEIVKYGNTIIYNQEFKKWAVKTSLEHPELTAKEIFEIAGFDTDIIGKNIPRERIRDWKIKYLKPKNELQNCNNNEVLNIVKKNNCLLQHLIVRMEKLISIMK